MPIHSVDIAGLDYSPSLQKEYDYQGLFSGADLLNENIARIESLKTKVMGYAAISPDERDVFLKELDILRGAFIDFANRTGQASPGKRVHSAPVPYDYGRDLLKLEGIIGQTPRINKVLKTIAKVAPTGITVLLEGETGTGKELFARIIHLNGRRKKFVAVNCGAFPSGVIESELFGHVKGAFTGATSNRKGKFEEADNGTIFLDEIGELALSAQVKLLRVLEEGELQRVGSDKAIRVNARVICATNKNLEDMVREGKFREDLYYRTNMCPLFLPPLRERRDEIEILFEHFLQEASAQGDKPLPKLQKGLRSFIYKTYDFPGNIRELKNMARLLACIAGDNPLTLEDLPERYLKDISAKDEPEDGHETGRKKKTQVKREAEKGYLIQVLKKHHGNIKKICAEMEVRRSRIYQLMHNYNLKPGPFR